MNNIYVKKGSASTFGAEMVFYFGFNEEQKPEFFAKKIVGTVVSTIRTHRLPDVIAWLGFDSLFHALCSDTASTSANSLYFSKFSRDVYHQLYKGRDFFYFWHKTEKRHMATDDFDLFTQAVGTDMAFKVEQSLGSSFKARAKELAKDSYVEKLSD